MDETLVRFRYHPGSKTAQDQSLQQDEALEIRLRWARRPPDVKLISALDASKRAAYRLVAPLPPDPLVGAVVDRFYALRDRLPG